MSGQSESGWLGGLLMGLGVAGIVVGAVATVGYIVREWGLRGLALANAVLTELVAGLVYVEAPWVSSMGDTTMGRMLAALVSLPWMWIQIAVWCFAMLTFLVAQLTPVVLEDEEEHQKG
jgi:Mg2+/Co2+ transporter CorB